MICQWRTAIYFQVKDSGSGPLDLNVLVFLYLYKKPFSTLKLQDQFYCCFARNAYFGTDAPKHVQAFFITIVRENLANRVESSRISVNSCPIRAAFGIVLTDS